MAKRPIVALLPFVIGLVALRVRRRVETATASA
jgi:hypothetical protein